MLSMSAQGLIAFGPALAPTFNMPELRPGRSMGTLQALGKTFLTTPDGLSEAVCLRTTCTAQQLRQASSLTVKRCAMPESSHSIVGAMLGLRWLHNDAQEECAHQGLLQPVIAPFKHLRRSSCSTCCSPRELC